jgi:hypothetical protein
MKTFAPWVAGCVVVLGAVWPAVGSAQSTPVIDQREANQDARINQGVATGRLSQREADRLRAGQARVDDMETAAKADGKVTRAERTAIHDAQDRQSRRIYKQKHDHNNR